jgi:hypothetical protein
LFRLINSFFFLFLFSALPCI